MEMTPPTLDMLTVGLLVKDGDVIKEAHSSSTLLRSDGVTVVVDTSSRERRDSIVDSLRWLDVRPEEVDFVVTTHAHHDHMGNDDLFSAAEFIMHRGEAPSEGRTVMEDDMMQIAPNVVLVHTPGHSRGSISVFVEGDQRYAVTGDAVPLEDNFRRMQPPGIHYDREVALQSIKRVGEFADIIVPGHGFPFPA